MISIADQLLFAYISYMSVFSDTIVVIPTLNEEKNIRELVPQLMLLMPGVSVFIVDDNSSDGTADAVYDLQREWPALRIVIRSINHGYGPSVLDGFRYVTLGNFRFTITMDADLSHDYRQIPAMRNALGAYDVVVGSRYISGGGISNWGILRRFLSRFANIYARTILRIPVHDITSGFVAYRKNAVESILSCAPGSNGYSFLVETKFVLYKKGYRIGEHPIIFTERIYGMSKMSLRKVWESVLLPWRLRWGYKRQEQ
jgi:dolichol-phosphate mannosyltransferase